MTMHQITNSYKNYNYNAYIYRGISYPRHFHGNYEIVYAYSGKINITSDNAEIILSEGELLLISPYTIHSIEINKASKAWVAVFSEDFIISFFEKNKAFKFSKFRCKAEYEHFLQKNLFVEKRPEHYMLISCLYMICAECERNAARMGRDCDVDFMFKAITFIEENFAMNIDLDGMAKAFGYEKHYFSSLFHKCFSVNFRQFLNIFRVEQACRFLTAKNIPLTDIAFNCGFGSIRNFNRVFKNMCGLTPSEFRNQADKKIHS